MPKKSKKFIDKKKAVRFTVAHRSQRDPLIADENAPQRVLLQHADDQKKEDRKEEQRKWGVYFDDDYNYLQHLRENTDNDMVWLQEDDSNKQKHPAIPIVEKHKLQLPSSVFESEFQEDEGMLRKAAPHSGPRPDLDPDIVAGLEEDFDYDDPENELEDDFMAKAMAEGSDEEEEYYSDCSSNFCSSGDEMDDDVASLNGQFTFRDEETKSKFTEYSMSSSVIRRNKELTLLDSRFEKLYESYGELDIGALDVEEIEGNLTTDHILEQYDVELHKFRGTETLGEDDADNIHSITSRLARLQEESIEDDEVPLEVEDPNKDRWDCESILSTYSNIYNHPKLIEEPKKPQKIQINVKTGLPMNVLGSQDNKLTAKSLAKFDQMNEPPKSAGTKSVAESVFSTLSILSIRPKDETPEERKERKKLLKEYRQERRIEKKANTEAFKEEKLRQVKIRINNKNNVQGNKMM